MLRVPYEPACEAAANRYLRYVDHVLFIDDQGVRDADVKSGTYLVDHEVHVARRYHLSVEQILLVADAANRPAGGFDGHHLLYHLFFVRVKEASKLRGVERSVQLQETAQCWDCRLRSHVRQEEPEMALCGLWRRIFRVSRQLLLVLVRWRISRDEFRARVKEELFKCRKALVSVGAGKMDTASEMVLG